MNPNDEAVPQAEDTKGEEATDVADGAAETTSVAKNHAGAPSHPAKKEFVATIGSAGKRRIAKVVGDDREEDVVSEERKPALGVKKVMKPKKRVKLSFDEEG